MHPHKHRASDEWSLLSPKEFELYVQSVYRSLGYRVSHNTNVGGSQIDLVAEKHIPGRGQHRLVIECKHKERGAVGVGEVRSFIAAVRIAIDAESMSAGILVTNTEFSQDAKLMARSSSIIELITVRDLALSQLDPSDAFIRAQADYTDDPISAEYIRLKANILGKGNIVLEASVDAEEEAYRYATTSGTTVTVIRGDFGAGKSTLLERLKQRFIQSFLAGQSELCPIKFNLNEFYLHDSVEQFVVSTVERETWRRISPDSFWKECSEGRYILLLDGFDEMAVRGTSGDRLRELKNLTPLITSGSSSILTCRPTYFVSDKEMDDAITNLLATTNKTVARHSAFDGARELGVGLIQQFATADRYHAPDGYLALDLLPLDRTAIIGYLESKRSELADSVSATPEEVYDFIVGIYDLGDLITRPLLLGMIAYTVLKGFFELSNGALRLTASNVYELYTNASLVRDWEKGVSRRHLTEDDRRQLVTAVALTMFDNDKLEVSQEELNATIDRLHRMKPGLHRKLSKLGSDFISADIRMCGFLRRTRQGDYSFTQKSFFDFFLGQHLHESIMRGELDRRLYRPLAGHFTYFMGGFILGNDEAQGAYYGFLSSNPMEGIHSPNISPMEVQCLRDNLFAALLCAGEISGPLLVRDVKLSARTIGRLSLASFRLVGATMSDVKLQNAELERCNCENLRLNRCTLENMRLRNGSMFSATSVDTTAQIVQCLDSQISLNGHGVANDWKYSRSTISLQGDWVLTGHLCEDSKVQIIVGDRSRVEDCKFAGSRVEVYGQASQNRESVLTVRLSRCKFLRCSDVSVVASARDIETCLFEDCKGFVAVTEWIDRGDKAPYKVEQGLIYFDANAFKRKGSAWKEILELLQGFFPEQRKKFVDPAFLALLGLGPVKKARDALGGEFPVDET